MTQGQKDPARDFWRPKAKPWTVVGWLTKRGNAVESLEILSRWSFGGSKGVAMYTYDYEGRSQNPATLQGFSLR